MPRRQINHSIYPKATNLPDVGQDEAELSDQQPAKADDTAARISSMVTSPSRLRSIGWQSTRAWASSAMFTPRMISSMVTSPLASQSPTQGPGVRVDGGRDGVAVRRGVAVRVTVAVGTAS